MELCRATTFSWTHTVSTSLYIPQPSSVSTHICISLFFHHSLYFISCHLLFAHTMPFIFIFSVVKMCETKRFKVWCGSDQPQKVNCLNIWFQVLKVCFFKNQSIVACHTVLVFYSVWKLYSDLLRIGLVLLYWQL